MAGDVRAAATRVARAAESIAPTAAAATVPPRVAVARGRGATAVVVAGLAGFTALFWLVRTKRSEAFDLALTLRLQRRRRPWLDRVMTTASWPGFPPQSRILPASLILGLWLARLRTEAAFLGVAWASAAVSTGLKSLMGRERPVAGPGLRVVVAPLGGSSFPSGHVLTFVGTYGFAAYLAATLVRDPILRQTTAGGFVALVALVGPSRIYEGHHWPTDVTASYLVGTAYLATVVTLYRRTKIAEASGRPAAV
ncbi:MAG TPA: phosphatase PAP2 family protein, partial [Candidatus Limnocylindrales bacterium]|nr:phosphatase PAP2 family protein [Candidatus Limnocylindrales bacterium]